MGRSGTTAATRLGERSLKLLGIRREIEDRREELGRLANRRLQPLGHLTALGKCNKKRDLAVWHFSQVEAAAFQCFKVADS